MSGERKVEREVVNRSALDLDSVDGDLAFVVRLRLAGFDLLLGRDVLLQVRERLAEVLVDRLVRVARQSEVAARRRQVRTLIVASERGSSDSRTSLMNVRLK